MNNIQERVSEGDDFASRVRRARVYYRDLLSDVLNGRGSQSDAEERAIRTVIKGRDYDYTLVRKAVIQGSDTP